MRTYLKYSCAFSLAPQEDNAELCTSWVEDVLERLAADPPDYVLTSAVEPRGRSGDGTFTTAAMQAGLREIWTRLTELGTEVVVVADNPHPGREVYECVAEHRDELSRCAFDRAENLAVGSNPVQHAAARGLAGVAVVDLLDAICPLDRCAPVIGDVLVYRAGSHLTATYVRTLTPRLASALAGTGLRATYRPGR